MVCPGRTHACSSLRLATGALASDKERTETSVRPTFMRLRQIGSPMRSKCFVLLCGLAALAVTCQAEDGPLSPEDAAASIKLPPGFRATLFAGEPAIVQPMAFTFDDRGRVWVVENLSYPT